MFTLRCDIYLSVAAIFVRVLNLISLSKSQRVFISTRNVTMDTSVCLFQNYTEPIDELVCIKLCRNTSACTGVALKQHSPKHWCCLVTDSEIQYRKPGGMILYKKDISLKCQTGRAGRSHGACAPNYGSPGQCDQCLRGFAGDNCDVCDTNFGPPGKCDTCVPGWGGDNCDSCAPGWTGPACDACDGFGFSEESNCTQCIQNGRWMGLWGGSYSMKLYMTFEGPACTNLVPGTEVDYKFYKLPVVRGNYDKTTGTLTVIDNNNNPVGQVNAVDKSIQGTLTMNTHTPFYLTYRG